MSLLTSVIALVVGGAVLITVFLVGFLTATFGVSKLLKEDPEWVLEQVKDKHDRATITEYLNE